MNNYFVKRRLEIVRPHNLLRVIRLRKVTLRCSKFPCSEIKGVLYQSGRSWVIEINTNYSHRECLVTLIHEVFHIILFEQKMDNPGLAQAYNDSVLNYTAREFVRRYPYATACLWSQVRRK